MRVTMEGMRVTIERNASDDMERNASDDGRNASDDREECE